MIVSVTAEHIAKGRPGHLCRCPIALALGDKAVGAVCVSNTYCSFDGKRRSLPPVAQQFVSDFDSGRIVQPLQFELEDVCVSK